VSVEVGTGSIGVSVKVASATPKLQIQQLLVELRALSHCLTFWAEYTQSTLLTAPEQAARPKSRGQLSYSAQAATIVSQRAFCRAFRSALLRLSPVLCAPLRLRAI